MKTTKSIRLDNELIAKIIELAGKDRRTFSNQVECLLEDALNKQNVELPTYKLKEFEEKLDKRARSGVATKQKKPVARFIKPTVDDVRGYCMEKGYTFDPEAFVANYESKGWKIGSNSMKSWKAACTTWHKRDLQKGNNNGQQSKSAYQQRVEAGDERSFNIDTDF